MNSIIGNKKARSVVEQTAEIIFTICAFFAVLAVISITVYMFLNGTPALTKVGLTEILFSTVWKPTAADPSYGILYVILTSIVGTTLAILLGVPIGVLTAVFFAETAPKPLSKIVRPAIELLAGIPSVIYGLLGILLLCPAMYKLEQKIFAGSATHQFTGGANLISAVLVLAIMILPTVINISESALRSVPASLKAASLGLGASRIQTIFRVTIPAAKSGIATAIVLGVGRAIGEAMAISLVSGSSVNAPLPFHSVRFLTTAIVAEMGYAADLHRQVLFTIGLVLFVFIMIINMTLNKILKGEKKSNEHRAYGPRFLQYFKQKKIRSSDLILTVLIDLAAAFSILLLIAIMGYVFFRGLPQISLSFLTSVPSTIKGNLWYRRKYRQYALHHYPYPADRNSHRCRQRDLLKRIRKARKNRPADRIYDRNPFRYSFYHFRSVWYGIFGTTLGLGYSILTGALTLTLMVLPLITRNTQEALKTVPATYRSGALGIGATKWYMIRTILLPSAMPGIITGIILAIGRIVGESAALLFTAGSGYLLPKTFAGFFKKIFESGGTLTIQLYLSMSKAQYDAAFGIAAVLLIIVLFINLLTKILAKKFDVSKLD